MPSGSPSRLKNILTHTPGFEEQIKDLFTFGSESPDLGAYLKTHIPGRIYPPGTVPAYSNYATALAGYIIERVSGRPFNDYIEENIFKPLGMDHSTFRQPLPPALAPFMSNGYKLASDEPNPFEVVVPFPAGSLSATGSDMARFMLAHLQDGKLDSAVMLRPETVDACMSPVRFRQAPSDCYGSIRTQVSIIGPAENPLFPYRPAPESRRGLGFFGRQHLGRKHPPERRCGRCSWIGIFHTTSGTYVPVQKEDAKP